MLVVPILVPTGRDFYDTDFHMSSVGQVEITPLRTLEDNV